MQKNILVYNVGSKKYHVGLDIFLNVSCNSNSCVYKFNRGCDCASTKRYEIVYYVNCYF